MSRKRVAALGILVVLCALLAPPFFLRRWEGFPRVLKWHAERVEVIRELARYRVTRGTQEYGPLEIPQEVRSIAIVFDCSAAGGSSVGLDYDYEILPPLGRPVGGGSGHTGTERRSLLRGGGHQMLVVVGHAGIAYGGAYRIQCSCTTRPPLNRLDLVIYEAKPKQQAEVAGTPMQSLDEACDRLAANPKDPEALRFLRTEWVRKSDDREWVKQVLTATYRPEIRVRRISKPGAPIPAEIVGGYKTRPGFLRGPFEMDVGMLIDGKKKRRMLRFERGGGSGGGANLGFDRREATLGEHTFQLHWVVRRFPPGERFSPPLWTIEGAGDPITVTLVEHLPEGHLRAVSNPKLDEEVRSCIAVDLERGGVSIDGQRLRLGFALKAIRPLPIALGHRFYLSVNGSEPRLLPQWRLWCDTPSGCTARGKGATGRTGTGRHDIRRFLDLFAGPGTYKVRLVLKPDEDVALYNLDTAEYWGGTYETPEHEVQYAGMVASVLEGLRAAERPPAASPKERPSAPSFSEPREVKILIKHRTGSVRESSKALLPGDWAPCGGSYGNSWPYWGGAELCFERRGFGPTHGEPLVLVSVDGASPELAGIDLDADSHDGMAALKELLGQMQKKRKEGTPIEGHPRRLTIWGRSSDLGSVPPLPPDGEFAMQALGFYLKEPALLARHPYLVALRLHGVKGDLKPLAKLTRLRSLELGTCQDFGDLTPLGSLRELRYLGFFLISRGPVSLVPLGGLTKLTTLHIRHGLVEDFTPLANLASLVVLELSHCYGLTDLEPLAKLTNLQELTLRRCLRVSDLTPLSTLPKLRTLDLKGCDGVTDLSPLRKLIRRGGHIEVDPRLKVHLDRMRRTQ